ncbi:NAD(+) synthase [Virgibacillus chiguensis]|uniref:NH(3)-dependent NAD(+) synthetase n=1 Tax=Virgibacillus chiguensis TaxID=411959 RepID=A0A1M5M7L2_9BACI|nr:NAD(+) synthase [Virgibacillus chiguensis]SHG73225.1 NAD+ synthase [Virgibacillus chiguensis]
MKKEVDEIVSWLQLQVEKTGVKGLAVGVSGGIDSAVVAALIKKACPDNSIGVIMPIHSSDTSVRDAKAVVDKLGIDYVTIDLAKVRDNMYNSIQSELQANQMYNTNNEKLAKANLSARLRMSTLYTIATNHNYLVVGTDNAAEWYTGYFTKYGDGGVDILPIVEFTKGEVKELAVYLGIPNAVVNKQPSADLWEGQSDEEEMGIRYALIDAYLKGEDIPQADRKKIETMHKRTAHKRESLPFFSRKK